VTKLRVGILGATGMVGQRFMTLLDNHPWFEVVSAAASPRSAGKHYKEAVRGRWRMEKPIPESVAGLIVRDVGDDLKLIAKEVDLVFCALDLDKASIRRLELNYASADIPVVSNNSAHRWTDDVPILMPEINPGHIKLIDIQRKNRGWDKGLIVVKPNCSCQSYVSILTALKKFEPSAVSVTSLQAISGAGKTFDTWPEMVDNVIPLIPGEEDKSEREPLKIWGDLSGNGIKLAESPSLSATCIRVPVSNGHMASVRVSFAKKPTQDQIIAAVRDYSNPIVNLKLPSAPKQFITYYDEPDRPQTKLDRGHEKGMGITMGRLREDRHFDWQFIALSHNTIRGAAGGAILSAELLAKEGYIIK
jgi:aspartate-semialdehyde dehydrogenase